MGAATFKGIYKTASREASGDTSLSAVARAGPVRHLLPVFSAGWHSSSAVASTRAKAVTGLPLLSEQEPNQEMGVVGHSRFPLQLCIGSTHFPAQPAISC